MPTITSSSGFLTVSRPLSRGLSLFIFLLSGTGFGLLFDRQSLVTPYFWVIFILLQPFFLLKPASSRWGFAEGMAFGLTANLLGIRWLMVTMQDYGHLSFLLAAGGLLLFSLYLSLFPGLFRMLTATISLWNETGRLSFSALLLAPTFWILTEAGRTEFLTGFPWNILGSLLFGHETLVLPARIVGTTGLSFLIILGSVFLSLFFEVVRRDPSNKNRVQILVFRGGILLLFFTLWTMAGTAIGGRIGHVAGDHFPVALIQGNIPPDQKWSADHLRQDFSVYRDLSQKGIAQGARILLWPETALPVFYNSSHHLLSHDLETLLSPDIFLVTGSIGEAPDKSSPFGVSFTNAAVLFGPDGMVRADYVKQHLVPFGEFLPLPEIFGWLRPLIGVTGDMARGERSGTFNLPSGLSLSPLICYEALYPSLSRKNLGNSHLFAVLSDDAWFGRTSAPYQLFRESAMRAIENGVPMIRAANTGVSGIVLPDGKVLLQGPLFETALLEADLPVPPGRAQPLLIYRNHGEWLLKGCLIALLFWRALSPLSRKRPISEESEAPGVHST